MITRLKENEVFVFGSNERGIHGAGAAKMARDLFGAEWGVGVGPTGQCYAIPTKDENIETLPLPKIETYVQDFVKYVENHPEKTFRLTAIGCGLAGYTVYQIAPMFRDVPQNLIFPPEFEGYPKL